MVAYDQDVPGVRSDNAEALSARRQTLLKEVEVFWPAEVEFVVDEVKQCTFVCHGF